MLIQNSIPSIDSKTFNTSIQYLSYTFPKVFRTYFSNKTKIVHNNISVGRLNYYCIRSD